MREPFHIRSQASDDDERVLEIEHAIFQDLLPPTVEEYRHDLSTLPANAERTAVIAEREGRIVGSAVWHRSLYVANPGAYRLSPTVDPPEQGRGVGSLPYDTWQRLVLRGPRASWDAIWTALDGTRPVGLANLQLRANHTAVNGYPVVDIAYRSRGIARALKLHTVAWAREQGIRYI